MNNVYAITTFNKEYREHGYNAESAADAWKECGVCAVGWSKLENLKKQSDDEIKQKLKNIYPNTKGAFYNIKDFLQIEKGDLILAYALGNTIAYVGEVVGDYEYRRDNKIGNENEFDFAHQFHVNWWNEPRYFSRKDLPEDIRKQLGIIGKTVIKINLGQIGFDKFKEMIKDSAKSDSQLNEINEDMVKAGLLKYLKQHFDLIEHGLKVEYGLKIIEAEAQLSQEDRPDFIAEDNNGKKVIIECKGTAYSDAFDQIKRYEKTYIKEKPRLMLIAFKISDDCRKMAKNSNVELIECDLKFKPI